MAEDYSKYYKDIQAEINRRKALNKADPTITDLERFRQAKIDTMREAQGAGADPNNIDINYVLARARGQQQPYVNSVLAGNASPMPSGTPALSGGTSRTNSVMRNTTPTAPTMPTTPTTPTAPVNDIQSNIDRLAKIRQDSITANLQGARNRALSNLTGEESKIKPMYYNQRNMVSAQSQLGARNFAEYLASRGEVNSGVNDQAQISRNMALQGNIGNLRQQEAADISDIARRRTDVNNAYETDLANARAGLEATTLEQTIAEMRRQQEMAREDARYNREFDYKAGRDAIADQRYAQEYRDNLSKFDREFSESQRRWNAQFAFDQRRQSFSERQQQVENALSRGNLSAREAEMQLARDKFAADNDPNSLDNQLKKSQLDLNTYSKSNAVLNDAIQRLDSMYLTRDNQTGSVSRNTNFSDSQLRNAIIGLGLPDEQTDALLLRYGLPIN